MIDVVAFQATACAQSSSPLYGRVLDAVVADLRAGGVTAELLTGRGDDPFGSALALRFLGAVHRIVLEGRAPELAAFYPSVGGVSEGDPGPAFLRTVEHHRDEVSRRIDDGVQTNEVGRSAVLVGGYAEVARRTGLPLRVLEVGASAGLNLRWDHFAYDTGRVRGRRPGQPGALRAGVGGRARRTCPATFEVVERAGCDRNPLDATTAEGRLTLMSYVWPDQLERFARLDAAIEVARRVPADRRAGRRGRAGSPPSWRTRHPGVATVVVHSIVLQYLSHAARAAVPRRRRVGGRPEPASERRSPGCGWSPAATGPSPADHLAGRRGPAARHGRLPRPPGLVGPTA